MPALTPLLIKGEEGTIHPVMLSDASATNSALPTNYLHGTLASEPTSADGDNLYYKLSYGKSDATSSILGFYWGNDGGSAFINKAYHAYLALPRAQAAQKQSFSIAQGEVTSIVAPQKEQNAASTIYYDIYGRRLTTLPNKGVVITADGKKWIR